MEMINDREWAEFNLLSAFTILIDAYTNVGMTKHDAVVKAYEEAMKYFEYIRKVNSDEQKAETNP